MTAIRRHLKRQRCVKASRFCKGQAMTEQILLIVLAVFAILGVIGLFMDSIGDFYTNVITMVRVPFP